MSSPFKILLLDDDEFTHLFFKRITGAFPYIEVRSFQKTEEARAALEKERFDFLIVDFVLPWTDGPEFLSSVKNFTEQGTQIYFLTGAHEKLVKKRVQECGCRYDGIVSKDDLDVWLKEKCKSLDAGVSGGQS